VAATAEDLKFEVLVGDDPVCRALASDLQAQVKLKELTAPATHQAGTQLQFQMTLTKTQKLDGEKWVRAHSRVNFNSIIKKPYTKFIHHRLAPNVSAFFFDDGTEMTFAVDSEVTQNIGGDAIHRLSFTLRQQQGDYCSVATVVGGVLAIASDNIDITPPLVRALSYDKLSYRPGEVAQVTVQFSEPLQTAESDHISFANRHIPIGDSTRSIPAYDGSTVHQLHHLEDNSYLFTFTVPVGTVQGSYHPEFFNRFDQWRNFADEIGAEDLLEKQVADTSPLVVMVDTDY